MSRIYHPIKFGEIKKTDYPYNVAYYMAEFVGNYSTDDLERIYYPGLIYVISKCVIEEKRKRAFDLYFKEKMTFKEIGEVMNLSSSRISHYIHECVYKINRHKYEYMTITVQEHRNILEEKLKEYSEKLHNSTYGIEVPEFINNLNISDKAKLILVNGCLRNFEDFDGIDLYYLCDLKGMKPKILSEIINALKDQGIYVKI